MTTTLADGHYRVDYKGVCAGFVVASGRVTACAPILAKRLRWWTTIAVKIS